MKTPAKRVGNFWPKMMHDFFGTENPFDWDEKFWLSEKASEIPSANVKETEKEFKIELAAPGFEKEDFKVEVLEGVLNISAEKQHETNEEKENYRKKEFSYSSIHRSFALPENVNEEQIDAKYKKGILNLTLPKMKLSAPKDRKAIQVV